MHTPFPSVPITKSYIPPKPSIQLTPTLILTPFSFHIQQHKIKLLKAKKEEDKRLPNPKRAMEEDSMEEEEEKEEDEKEEGDRKVDKKRRRK